MEEIILKKSFILSLLILICICLYDYNISKQKNEQLITDEAITKDITLCSTASLKSAGISFFPTTPIDGMDLNLSKNNDEPDTEKEKNTSKSEDNDKKNEDKKNEDNNKGKEAKTAQTMSSAIAYKIYDTQQVVMVDTDITENEFNILLKIVASEAGAEDIKGQILVANVILNRVKSSEFPNNIEDVVFQTSYGVTQFSPIDDGSYYSAQIGDDTIEAVTRALSGEDISQGALFFCARQLSDSNSLNWFDNNLTWLYNHGNHEFYTL